MEFQLSGRRLSAYTAHYKHMFIRLWKGLQQRPTTTGKGRFHHVVLERNIVFPLSMYIANILRASFRITPTFTLFRDQRWLAANSLKQSIFSSKPPWIWWIFLHLPI